MSESRDSILDILKFRLNNSFLSSVIISWPIVNYKFLMVVFGGGNYLQKIEYIDKILYEPGSKSNYFIWIPICIGAFYVAIFPFLEILLNVINMFFANLNREVILWRQRRDVITRDELETHFTDLTTTNKSLKDEIQKIRVSYSQQNNAILENYNTLVKRFRYAAFDLLALNLGKPPSMANDMYYTWHVSLDLTNPNMDAIIALCDSEIFSNLKKFSANLIGRDYDTETRKIVLTKDEVFRLSEVHGDKLDEFITYILAFDILREVESQDPKFHTHKRDDQIKINEKFESLYITRQTS